MSKLMIVVAACCGVFVGTASASYLKPELRLPAEVSMDEDRLPGGVLLVWDGGRVVTNVVGYADLATRRRMRADDCFWVASNTKAIACALVLTYVDEGKIGLDDPVEKYIPSWKGIEVVVRDKAGRVVSRAAPKTRPTVRQLMGHRAGLGFYPETYPGGRSISPDYPITSYSVAQLAEIAVREGLCYEPDTRRVYSNWGIDVAAAICEVVGGEGWDALLARRVLGPLGMSETFFSPTDAQMKRLATSYRLFDDRPPEATHITQFAWPYGGPKAHPEAGGGLFSTAGDLLRFFRMLASGGLRPDGTRFLSRGTMEEWYGVSPYYRSHPESAKYTFGTYADAAKGTLRHGGAYRTDAKANWRLGTAFAWCTQQANDSKLSLKRDDAWESEVGAFTGGMSLAEDARAEMRRAVRPGGVEGRAFWNGHSKTFMYPPAFDFKSVPGAADYLYRVTDDFGGVHTFRDPRPTASLLPVWEKLRTTNGFVTVTCLGADKSGKVIGEAGFRSFFRRSPYVPGSYPAAACSYSDCARRIRAYVSTLDIVTNFTGTVRDAERYCLYSYPSKLLSSLVKALLRDAEAVAERRETSRAVALRMGEFLLAESFPATAAWPNVPPTYWGPADDSTNAVMTCYPADAGRAYLALARATGDGKWRAAAQAIGETYLAKQGDDGSWCMKVDARSGEELVRNRIVPLGISDFLAELGKVTGDARYGAAAARAFGNVLKTRLATWNWEGQFEDTRASAPYENLTKHEACSTAIGLLRRHPKDPAALADARELLRFAEDQFVFWTRPRRPDGASPIDGGLFSRDWRVQEWVVPSVTEQYFCYWPIDASVAKLIRTYLALYRAEGRPLDLAKARTLGDSVTRIQDRRGRVPTFWVKFTECPGNLRGAGGWYPGGGFVDWLNCMIATAEAMDELAAIGGGTVE